jgi:hypothetical protein
MVKPDADKKAQRDADAAKAWAEHLANQRAVDQNMERLRALRLAKEARAAAEPEPAGLTKKRKRK